MNLIDLPAGFEDPVESLLGFHRRLERQLAQLGRLPGLIEAFGAGAETAAIAAASLHCFGVEVPLHHEDEERDLLPLLQRRLPAGELAGFRDLLRRLEADHREINRSWRELRRPLQGLSEGMPRRLPVNEVQYFRAIATTHISIEEGALHTLAMRWLRNEDRQALGRRMRARRFVTKSSSD